MIAMAAWEFCMVIATTSLCMSIGFVVAGINTVLRAKAAKLRKETNP